MPTPFSRTLRSIRSDGFRVSGAGALLAAAFLAAWGVWFARARIDVTETCTGARISVATSLLPIEAPADGSVSAVHAVLGSRVRAGDVLLELDGTELELAIAAERASITSAEAELAALVEALRAEERAFAEASSVAGSVLEEERLRRAEHELALELAREEVARLELLQGDGIVSELDLVRARGVVRSRELALELHDASHERKAAEERRAKEERRARMRGLDAELERQRGLIAGGRAKVDGLAHALARRRIVAPRDGTIAELRDLARGSNVRVGERLAAIVSTGDWVVVADFAPSASLGRIAVGQRAELRLDGFPWSRFGTLALVVERVGGEPREGLVRVELALALPNAAIPLQHGLPGTVEIVVDRVSPAELVLRTAGLAVARADSQ